MPLCDGGVRAPMPPLMIGTLLTTGVFAVSAVLMLLTHVRAGA